MSHKNPWTAALPEGIPLTDSFTGQPAGLEGGSDQHRPGKRSSAFPESGGRPAPHSSPPQTSLCLPMSFSPSTTPPTPCQLSTPARHGAAPSAGLCSLSSPVPRQSPIHQAMRQELEKDLPPLSSPSLRKGIWARTSETLAQTLPQSTDLLKEIKCFALHEPQRERHPGLAGQSSPHCQHPLAVCSAHAGCRPN